MENSSTPTPTPTAPAVSRGSLGRRIGTTLAGTAAAAALVAAYAPGFAHAETAAPAAPALATPAPAAPTAAPQGSLIDPEHTDYSDCPELPAGVDPARWRCEVSAAAPELTMGGVKQLKLAPITMTHAEGPLADGTMAQVWGAMHTAPTAVPGGLTGTGAGDRSPLLGMTVEPRYGGRSDFYTGQISLGFRLAGPLLPEGCGIAADAPVDFRLKRSGKSVWLSQNPPLIKFAAYADEFAVPAAKDCGPLSGLLNRRLGLPSASGNLMTYDAEYTFKTYDQLPTR
ncbi:hypothetical protein [Saccharothrix sp. ST-888]|uniref:hypothetical protein n=1 Tax=Saccharothrix sp. ST-888 TaxID=1427391 RepID=UPI0018CEB041|nr:hypothetical protein [Saccharothrix sp. ST-888]